MPLHIINTDNVSDDATLELTGARAVTTAVIGGITYLFTGAESDDGVSVFSVAADGTLTNVDNETDNATLELDNVRDLAAAVVGGTTYLFVAGFVDDGVSVFSVAANGTLTNVDNVADNATLELDGPHSVTTAVIGGVTYLFVTGFFDDGVSVFSVAANGTLTNVANVSDNATLKINEARHATIAVVSGNTYLFVPGDIDNGLSVFSVAANGTLTNVDNISDDATLELMGGHSTTTAVIGGTTYLFVTGSIDDGVSVFSVAANGALTNVDNVTDSATLGLDGANSMTTAVIGGTTYLFVTSGSDDALVAFSVAANGILTRVANIVDNATLELDAAGDVTRAVVGGTTYLFVTGQFDNGVSVFSAIELTPNDFNGDGRSDILWRHSSGQVVEWQMNGAQIAANLSVAIPGNEWHFQDTGDFGGDGRSDVMWRHDTGQVVLWQMNGNQIVSNTSIQDVSNQYHVQGLADFGGDGKTDVLFRHDSGQVVLWQMNGDQIATNTAIATVSRSFHIEGVGDFGGDGKSDVLWRHDSGQVVLWQMDGDQIVVKHCDRERLAAISRAGCRRLQWRRHERRHVASRQWPDRALADERRPDRIEHANSRCLQSIQGAGRARL